MRYTELNNNTGERVVVLGNSILWTRNSDTHLLPDAITTQLENNNNSNVQFESCDENEDLEFKEAVENPEPAKSKREKYGLLHQESFIKTDCYDIYFKLRKFNINASYVNVCLDQRGCPPLTETRSIACLRNNTWRARVKKLSSLRLLLRDPDRDKNVYAKFPLTGLGIGKSHELTKGNEITATFQIETKHVDESYANIKIGSVIIKLEDGNCFPFENDDEIGPTVICFMCGGQKSTSTTCSGTRRPLWNELFHFNILDPSELSVIVSVLRTDQRSGKQEEVSKVTVDFAQQIEGNTQKYEIKLNRDDYNPMFINITLSYSFQRQLHWLENNPKSYLPVNEYLRFVGGPLFGKVKIELYHWNPIVKSSFEDGFLFMVVQCGTYFGVTKSSTRSNQEPCHSIIFPLQSPFDCITISVYEDALYEVNLIGQVCLPPSSQPVAVSYPAVVSVNLPKVDIRFRTTVDVNISQYLSRCFRTNFNNQFHINEQAEEEYGRVIFKDLLNVKNFLILALKWKEKLLTLSFLFAVVIFISIGRLWHVPMIGITQILLNLFRVKLSNYKSTSLSNNPIVSPLTFDARSFDLEPKPTIQCQCSQHETCLVEDKRKFNPQNIYLSYLRWVKSLRQLREYWTETVNWVHPIQSSFTLVTLFGFMLLMYFLSLSQITYAAIVYAFVRPLLGDRDLLFGFRNFISNRVPKRKIREMVASIPFSRKLRVMT